MSDIIKVRGVARYPHLNTPDTKFDDAGVYKVDLILDQETGAPIEQRFEKMREAKLAETQKKLKGKKAKEADLPIQPEYDDDGNETGNYVLRTKMKASGISKKGKAWSRKVPLFDAAGNPTSALIRGGSEIIVAMEIRSWANPKGECSVTCYLEAVQVIRLSDGTGGASASRFGFGAVEGGYVDTGEDTEGDTEDEAEVEQGEDEQEYDF